MIMMLMVMIRMMRVMMAATTTTTADAMMRRDTRDHDYDDGKQRGGETYHKKGAEAKPVSNEGEKKLRPATRSTERRQRGSGARLRMMMMMMMIFTFLRGGPVRRKNKN